MKISQAKKLIPQEVIDKYRIGFHQSGLDIHLPQYISISGWKKLIIEETAIVIRIRNDKTYITLWKDSYWTHTTIF